MEKVCLVESEDWLKSCNVKKTDYHGGQLTGNDSRKLLQNTEKIENAIYAKAFSAFNDVVEACYGDDLSKDYVLKIPLLANAYNELKISIAPKIHAVVFHIEDLYSIHVSIDGMQMKTI